jgi:hypothetical protein
MTDPYEIKEVDKELASRLRKLTNELELALQEMSARGWNVEFQTEWLGAMSYVKRPLYILISRRLCL